MRILGVTIASKMTFNKAVRNLRYRAPSGKHINAKEMFHCMFCPAWSIVEYCDIGGVSFGFAGKYCSQCGKVL